MNKKLFYIIILIVIAGCSGKKLDTSAVKSKWLHELAENSEVLNPGKPYSLQIISDSLTGGKEALRFELRNSEKWRDKLWQSSFRSEIKINEHFPINSEKWYAFKILLPQDFPVENNRLVLAQWHGVTKSFWAEPPRSPVMAFRFKNGKFYINMKHSPYKVVDDPDTIPTVDLFKTHSFPLGKWNSFIVQAKWSYHNDGLINIWWNGQQIVHYSGPVGYNEDEAPHFQFGIYRDKTDKTYVTYMEEIKIGSDSSDVDFKPSLASKM